MPNLIAGLDLGQSVDPTAYVAIEKSDATPPVYSIRRLTRFDLRTPYPEIVRAVCEAHAPGKALAECPLAIDQTGVGRPVVDMFAEAGVNALVYPITITGGNQWTKTPEGDFRVPKTDLVGVLQVLLSSGRLKAAPGLGLRKDGSGQNLTGLLLDEMQNFRVKVSKQANEIYGAREGTHDDIVLCVALAVWISERVFVGGWDTRQGGSGRTEMSQAPPEVWRPGEDSDDGASRYLPKDD